MIKKVLNIKEFATVAGVSVATVSRVFSNDAKVAVKTRKMVLDYADKYSYRPNLVAKGLLDGHTQSVGVLLHNLNTSYFADIAYGIQEVMQPLNYLPIISSIRNESGMQSLLRLIDHRVEAIIACVSDFDLSDAELAEIRRFKLPMVTIDKLFHHDDCDNVGSDESACGLLAAECFIKNGHCHLGVFSSGNGIYKNNLRIRSFIETVKRNDIKVSESAILLESEKKFDLAGALSKNGKGFGYYCYNDKDAALIYDATRILNWRIPEDISIIGTADLNFAKFMYPGLTTIRQNGIENGRMAAKIILNRINGDDSGYKHVNSDVALIERGSVHNKNSGVANKPRHAEFSIVRY